MPSLELMVIITIIISPNNQDVSFLHMGSSEIKAVPLTVTTWNTKIQSRNSERKVSETLGRLFLRGHCL